MLVLTLLLLLAGIGFLVVALVLGPITLAWGAIAASVAAALTLMLRSWRQRRADRRRRSGEAAGRGKAGRPEPRSRGSGRPGQQRGEPAEEDTDAADLLVVCELDDQVLVIDEHPRYHLDGCSWLATRPATRPTQSLPVSEARDLGFTPCARCGPDAELARRHRTANAG